MMMVPGVVVPKQPIDSWLPCARRSFVEKPRYIARVPNLLCHASQTPDNVIQPALDTGLPSDAEVVPLTSRALPPADERYSGLKVLVAGATGGVGRAVVRQLIDQGVPVRAMVRDGVRAVNVLPTSPDMLEIIEGDVYKYKDCVRALRGATAVIIATGPTDRLDPLQPYKVDFQGNANLVAASKAEGVEKIVLVTSIGTDDILFPLNALWGVLWWKKQGELAVQRSGLNYTIIRPGGLLNEARNGKGEGGLTVGGADTFGLPPRRGPGSVLRSEVAAGCIAALVTPESNGKIIEVIQEQGAPKRAWTELFASTD
jgi:uncharacterized protein YbjT (DUF2867 family)